MIPLEMTNILLVLQILLFGVALPTVDTYSDLALCWNLFMSNHYLWALAILLPIFVCFAFTSFAFYKIPYNPPCHQYIGLPLLLLQVRLSPNFFYIAWFLRPECQRHDPLQRTFKLSVILGFVLILVDQFGDLRRLWALQFSIYTLRIQTYISYKILGVATISLHFNSLQDPLWKKRLEKQMGILPKKHLFI